MNKNTPFQSITPPLEYDKFSINNNTYKTYHIEQKTTKVNKTFNTKKKDIIYIDYNDKLIKTKMSKLIKNIIILTTSLILIIFFSIIAVLWTYSNTLPDYKFLKNYTKFVGIPRNV